MIFFGQQGLSATSAEIPIDNFLFNAVKINYGLSVSLFTAKRIVMNIKNMLYAIAAGFFFVANYSFAKDVATCEAGYSLRMERGGAVCVKPVTPPMQCVDIGPRQCPFNSVRIYRETYDGGDLCRDMWGGVVIPALDCSSSHGLAARNNVIRGGQDRCSKWGGRGSSLQYGKIVIKRYR